MMATAGKVTLAEVENLVPVGALDPDQIHTPGIFVDRIFQGATFEKRIERVTTRPRPPRRPSDGLDPRRDGRPRGPGAEGRLLRQPRHRHPDPGGQLHSRRHVGDPAERERHAGHGPLPLRGRGRRRPDQRRQADHHRAAQLVLFLQRRLLRDDPRRPHRPVHPGRHAGGRERRPGQLDGAGQDGQGHGRGHGPGRRRRPGGGGHGPHRKVRRAEAAEDLHPAADRRRRGRSADHRSGRLRDRRQGRRGDA